MSEWYQIKEQCAGRYRLQILWYVYKLLRLSGLKIILIFVSFFIALFARQARQASRVYADVLRDYCNFHHLRYRRFSCFRHIWSYACSLADKMSAVCDPETPLQFEVKKNKDWFRFNKNIEMGQGVFLISSHLGNVEAFCAYASDRKKRKTPPVHALMEVNQNSIFHHFIEEKSQNKSFQLYPASQMDLQMIMTLYEHLCQGDILLMAGDRVSAQNPDKTLHVNMFDKTCCFPIGTFQFAQKMKHPTYAILLLKTKRNTYQIVLKELDTTQPIEQIAASYARFLEQNCLSHPTEWYNFYTFFQ